MLSSAEVLEASWQKPSHLWVQTLKAKVCPVDELQRTRLPMRSSMATRYSRFFGTTTNRAVQKHFLRWRKICLVYKSNDGYPTERRLSLSKDPNPMLFVVNLSATLEPRNRKSLQIVLDVLSVEVLSYCSLSRGLIIGNLYIKQRACLDVVVVQYSCLLKRPFFAKKNINIRETFANPVFFFRGGSPCHETI